MKNPHKSGRGKNPDFSLSRHITEILRRRKTESHQFPKWHTTGKITRRYIPEIKPETKKIPRKGRPAEKYPSTKRNITKQLLKVIRDKPKN